MKRTFAALIALQLFVSTALAEPTKPIDDDKPDIHGSLIKQSSGVTVGAKDFTEELPGELQTAKAECKTSEFEVTEKARFKVIVHYDELVDHPEYFKRTEVSIDKPVSGVAVSVTFGDPVNMGTSKKPVMAVPFLLQYSGAGWLRTEQWTIYPKGKLEKAE